MTNTICVSDYMNASQWEALTSEEKTRHWEAWQRQAKPEKVRTKPAFPQSGHYLKSYKGENIRINSADKAPLTRFEAIRRTLPYTKGLSALTPEICAYLGIDKMKALFNTDLKRDYLGQAMAENLYPLWIYYSQVVTGSHYFERLNNLEAETTGANELFSEGQQVEIDNRRALYREDIASACAIRYAKSRASGRDIFQSMTYAIYGGRELWNILTNRRKLQTIPLDMAVELQAEQAVIDAIGAVNILLESNLDKASAELLGQVLNPVNYSKSGKLIWLRVDTALGFGRGKSKRHFQKVKPVLKKALLKQAILGNCSEILINLI